MPVANVFKLHGLKTPGTFYNNLESATPDSGIDELSVMANGDTEPGFVANGEEKPRIPLQTYQIASALAEVGLTGNPLPAGDTDLLYRRMENRGSRYALASNEHFRLRMSNAFAYLTQITAGHHKRATADMTIIPLKPDASNPAYVPAGSQAIADEALPDENFVLGPVLIQREGDAAATVLDCVHDMTLQMETQTTELGCASEESPSFGAVDSVKTTLQLTTYDASYWETHHAKKLISFTVFLIKKDPDGGNLDFATAEHIAFTGSAGKMIVEQLSGDPVEARLMASLRRPAAGTPALAANVASAIVLP